MKGNVTRRATRFKKGEESSSRYSEGDYLIGYRRPPVTSRFQPGSSGNPKGRPKNSKNLKTLIRQAMTAKISIREGPNSRRVSKIEGVVLRQLKARSKAMIGLQWRSSRWRRKWASWTTLIAILPKRPP